MLRTLSITLTVVSVFSPGAVSGASGADANLNPLIAGSSRPGSKGARIDANYGRLPLAFEANRGQSGSGADFLAHGRGYALFLTAGGASLRLRPGAGGDSALVGMKLLGAARQAKGEAAEPLPGKANYFLGANPARWRTGIPTFARVRYREVYPGIDIVYYGNQGRLEYDFAVASGADPNRIELEFTGVEAARLDEGGDLLLNAAGSELRVHRPVIYQETAGARREVDGRFRMVAANRVRFEIARYDRTKPLTIDPILTYSAVLGGSAWEMTDYHGKGLAADGSGNVYVTGATFSSDFPATTGAHQSTQAGSPDVFIAKLSADGATLLYSTHLGGAGYDRGTSIAVDTSGSRVAVGGYTNSASFPTLNPFKATYAGGDDAFVAGLDSAGKLVYSTYLGGAAHDEVLSVAVDAAGNGYAAGKTASAAASITGFPTLNAAFGTTNSGQGDGFVASFDPSGTLLYSGVLGGSGEDIAWSIAAFGGAAYVAGSTCPVTPPATSDFPVKNAYNATAANCDAFVAKVNAGGAVAWSTFLGGTGYDQAWGVAADASGVYMTGSTYSSDFPRVPSTGAGPIHNDADAFLAKLNPDGSALLFSRVFGGAGDEFAFTVALDGAQSPIVGGITESQDFPVTADALQAVKLGSSNPVFASSDGGASWTGTAIAGLAASRLLRAAPGNPATVYVSDGTWVYKSTDAGLAFPHAPPPHGRLPFTANDLAVHPTTATTLYAATQGGGVQRSTDGGGTWSGYGAGLPADVEAVAVSADASVIYAAAGTALYKFTTGPAWTAVPGPWASTVAVTRILTDPVNPASVYVGTEDGLFKSTDAADTLHFQSTSPCFRLHTLTMDPLTPATLYVADGGQVCKSTNGGGAWTATPMGINEVATAMAVDPATPSTLYVAFGDKGIYKSVNSGASWAGITGGSGGAPFRLDYINSLVAGSQLLAGVTTNPDIFLTRFSADGTAITSSTYLGGPGSVDMSGMAADAGNVYLLVPTSSKAFPATPGAFKSATAGSNDVYVLKIANASGACGVSLWPAGLPGADAGGGAGTMRVMAGSGCAWGAITAPSWVQTAAWGGTASGLGILEFSYDPNTTGSTRTGNIGVGGQIFAITQPSSTGCTLALSAPLSFSTAAGTGNFTVTPTPSTCSWTAVSNAPDWLTVTSNAGGTGTQTVDFSVAANSGAARSSTISFTPVGATTGATGSVAQSGEGTCTLLLLNVSAEVAATGGLVAVQIQSSPEGCAAWAVSGQPSWATLTSSNTGTGSGTTILQIAPNAGTARTGTVQVGGNTFTINQAAAPATACAVTPIAPMSPVNGALTSACTSPSRGAGFYSRQYSFTGTAGQQIAVELVSPDSSFRTYLGLSGPGGTNLNSTWYQDQPNSRIPEPAAFFTLPATASYTIEVGSIDTGATGNYTLQLISACGATLSQLALAAPAGGGSFSVPFTSGGCTWTATSFTPGWLQITSAPSGNTAGNLTFNVGANAGGPRLGVINVSGQIVSVSQAAASGAFSFNPPSASLEKTASPVNAVTVTPPAPGTVWQPYSSQPWLTIDHPATGRTYTGTAEVTYAVAANPGAPRTAQVVAGGATFTVNQAGTALRFIPMTPCRVLDTRSPNGPSGGPFIPGGGTRDLAVTSSSCSVPTTAQAFSLNVTAVPHGPLGYMTIWPTGMSQPYVSTLNSGNGQVKANAAIVPAGQNGSVSIFSTNDTHAVIDINGYFVPVESTTSGLAFYPLTPCRVIDTRVPGNPSAPGGIPGGHSIDVPVRSSSCGVPASAQAYSTNVTVIPRGPLGYLTTWPTGVSRPLASTLNASNGLVTANAAIVPAGTDGSISVYASNDTDLVVDINGYFGPPATGGQSFYALPPCRVSDTRNPDGPLGGPILAGGSVRSFNAASSGCSVPATAGALSLNATVVPAASMLGYLTLWPSGGQRPLASTLNSTDGQVVANAAIVPAVTGSVSVYPTHLAHLVLDINGYFAP